MPKQVTITLDNFQDGMATNAFRGGKNQFAPTSQALDYFTAPGIIQPTLDLATDTGLSNEIVRSVIKASNGTYYWVGTAGTNLRVSTGNPELASSTTLTSSATSTTPTNMAIGSKLVEFDDFLFFYDTTTDLAKFNIGTPAITLNAPSGALTSNEGLDLLTYKSFLFYCNNNNVGRATSNTAYNSTALVLETRYQVMTLTGWNNFVVVGASTDAEGDNSRLFIWDGVSTLYDYSVPLPSHGLRAAVNNNGVIYLFCVNNAEGSTGRFNLISIYRWAGGSKVELVRTFDLEGSSTSSFTVYPAAVDAYEGKVYFSVSSGTANVMSRDNGVFSINEKGAINLEYIAGTGGGEVATMTSFFVKWINNMLFFFYGATGGVDRRLHWSARNYGSARLDTLALQFDPRYESRIDEIFFRTISLPASTSIAVSIATDQAAFTAVKTFDADNAVANIAINQNDFAFQPGHTHQLRFAYTSSTTSRAQIILPVYIKATVYEAQTLTS